MLHFIHSETAEQAPVESNVLDWVAHQLTVEGPPRKVPAYFEDLPGVCHGFIEHISLDDRFESVFGSDD